VAGYDREMHRETKRGAKVFISCGQVTEAEKNLGSAVCDLIRELTPYEPYFAQNQTNLEGLTKNILEALNDAVGLVAIMHPGGKVSSLGDGQHTRASIWIEQEIAIAAFITQVLKRQVRVAAYVHQYVEREGMREQLQLNPHRFIRDDEVLVHLRSVLPEWVDLGSPRELHPAPLEPDPRIENANHGNFLILKSDREFRLHRVCVMGPSGAILHELPKSVSGVRHARGVTGNLYLTNRRGGYRTLWAATRGPSKCEHWL
jgi:hypothetical protein